jgi:hypothetical protein
MKGQTIQAKLTCQNNQAKKSIGSFKSISFIIDKKIVFVAMISFTELQVLFLLCMTTYVSGSQSFFIGYIFVLTFFLVTHFVGKMP